MSQSSVGTTYKVEGMNPKGTVTKRKPQLNPDERQDLGHKHSQRAQYPLIREYGLHIMIQAIFLNSLIEVL